MTNLDYAPLDSVVTRRDAERFMRATGQASRWGSSAATWILTGIFLTALLCIQLLANNAQSRYNTPSQSEFNVQMFVIFVLAGWAYVAVMILKIKKREPQHVRLSRFASANGLRFTSHGAAPHYPGIIFGLGKDREMPERLTRTAQPAFSLGNYQYTVKSGKSEITHRWGFMAIKLDRRLPHMIVDAKCNNLLGSNLPHRFSKHQTLSLEGQFDEFFTLYCPKEYERDALYVFTPDLMACLIDYASELDLEIIDDWIFFYSARQFDLTRRHTLARMFTIADRVGGAALKRTSRYSDDRTAKADAAAPAIETDDGIEAALSDRNIATPFASRLRSNVVAHQGRRLRLRVPAFAIFSLIVFGILVALMFL